MAKPTALEIPWPRGPVVTSIPEKNVSICAHSMWSKLLTVSMVSLRVTGGQRVNLAKRLEIIQRELVAQEMEGNVLKSTAVWEINAIHARDWWTNP
jgi:hypothetical protein